jgi:hypothetical protein
MTENTAEAQAKAIAAEYGRWTAKEDIRINGVLAFHAGDAVPVSTVEAGTVSEDQVVGSNTKAAAAAKEG